MLGMATMLSSQLQEIAGVEIMFPTEANAVFANLPPRIDTGVRDRGWHFYNFIGAGGARLMCSWDTQPDDVERFVADCLEFA